VFAGLKAMIYKEAIQVRRDPATKFVFMVPVIQLIIFGYAIDTDIRQIPTVVFNADRRTASRDFLSKLANTDVFAMTEEATDVAGVREAIVAGRAQVGIVIPHDYSESLLAGRSAQVQVLIDGSNNNTAMQALNVANGAAVDESLRRLTERVQPPIDLRPIMLFNEDMTSSRFFVPGLVGIILQLVTMLLTSFSIVRERERGTMEQLMVTPVSRSALMLGKLCPFAVIGMIEACLVLALMVFVFDVPIVGNKLLLLALSALFMLPSLGLGLLISTVASNQAQALQMGLLLMLPAVLLSGFMFPREQMPLPIWALSCLLPVTYYIQILRGIILRGAEAYQLWYPAAMLLLFGVVILTISTLRFQKRIA
jgi:ABC-type multidrug transport system permease subunit